MSRKGSTSGGKKEDRSDRCSDCSKIVTDRDAAIQCEICEVWFHAGCQNVSDEAYKALKEIESLHWYCDGCNRGASKILHMMSAIKERQEKLDHDFGIMKQEVIVIKQDLEMLMQKTTEIGQEVKELKAETGLQQEGGGSGSGTFADMVTKQVEIHMATVHEEVKGVQQTLSEPREQAREEKDKENRANNVILYRIPESDADTPDNRHKEDCHFATQLFNAVNSGLVEDDIVKAFRLGKRQANAAPRPLLLQLGSRMRKVC